MIIKERKDPVKHSYFVPSFYYAVTLCTDWSYFRAGWDDTTVWGCYGYSLKQRWEKSCSYSVLSFTEVVPV